MRKSKREKYTKKAKLLAFAFLVDEITPILEHLQEWDGSEDALVLVHMADEILADDKRRVFIQP